jgi:hypothetical protein
MYSNFDLGIKERMAIIIPINVRTVSNDIIYPSDYYPQMFY